MQQRWNIFPERSQHYEYNGSLKPKQKKVTNRIKVIPTTDIDNYMTIFYINFEKKM